MAKHKTVKEMMAARQTLTRKPVEPINIYSTPPATEETEPKPAKVSPQKPKTTTTKDAALAQADTEPLRPYSTYLRQGQVKGIKRRAVEWDIKDMKIVQEAVDEYFKNHPL